MQTKIKKTNRAECFKSVYYSNLGKKKKILQRLNHEKNFLHKRWTEKKTIMQATKIPTPPHPTHHFSNGPSLSPGVLCSMFVFVQILPFPLRIAVAPHARRLLVTWDFSRSAAQWRFRLQLVYGRVPWWRYVKQASSRHVTQHHPTYVTSRSSRHATSHHAISPHMTSRHDHHVTQHKSRNITPRYIYVTSRSSRHWLLGSTTFTPCPSFLSVLSSRHM